MKRLAFAIISILALGTLLRVERAEAVALSCTALFANPDDLSYADYRILNPTAEQAPSDYRQPNQRPWKAYAWLLFKNKADLQNAIYEGDTVLDIGGGRGKAMWQLANRGLIRAIVINTQNYQGNLPRPKVGTLEYKTGWAEEILPTMRDESVNEAFDFFGAFHYSTRKDFLLEEIYRILKPGGQARVLFDYDRSLAFVDTPHGRVRLDEWLVATYPEIFSVHRAFDGQRQMSVIKITKPLVQTSRLRTLLARFQKRTRFSLGLETVRVGLNSFPNPPVASVLYRSK